MANANCTGMSTTMSSRVLRTAGQKLASVTMRCDELQREALIAAERLQHALHHRPAEQQGHEHQRRGDQQQPGRPLRGRGGCGAPGPRCRGRASGRPSRDRADRGGGVGGPARHLRVGEQRREPPGLLVEHRAHGAGGSGRSPGSSPGTPAPTCASRLPSPTGGRARIASRLAACASTAAASPAMPPGRSGGELHRRHGEERVLPQGLHLHGGLASPRITCSAAGRSRPPLGSASAREDEHVAAALRPARGGHHQPVVRLVLRGADEPGDVVPRHQHLAAGQRLLHVLVVGGRGRGGRPELRHVGPGGLGVGAAERRDLPAGEAGQEVALDEAVEQPLRARGDAEHRAARRRPAPPAPTRGTGRR